MRAAYQAYRRSATNMQCNPGWLLLCLAIFALFVMRYATVIEEAVRIVLISLLCIVAVVGVGALTSFLIDRRRKLAGEAMSQPTAAQPEPQPKGQDDELVPGDGEVVYILRPDGVERVGQPV